MTVKVFKEKLKITSGYGMRTLAGQRQMHSGVDFVSLTSDKQIYSPITGTVIQSRMVTDKSNLTWQWGNYVTVRDNQGYQHIFAHMSKRLVKVGDIIEIGTVLGIEGTTGYSSGNHLHYEVRTSSNNPIDPSVYYKGLSFKVGTYNFGLDIKVGTKVLPNWDWYVKKIDGDMVEIASKTGLCKFRCQAKNVKRVGV